MELRDRCDNGDLSPSYYDGLCDKVLIKSPSVVSLLKEIEPEQQLSFDTYDFTQIAPLPLQIRKYIELRYVSRVMSAIDKKTDDSAKKVMYYKKIVVLLDKYLD